MKFRKENGCIGAVLVFLLVLGLLVPILVVSVTGLPTNQMMLVGEPIENTTFSSISSDAPNEAMLPGGIIHSEESGVYMIRNTSDLTTVNQSIAIDSFLSFSDNFSYNFSYLTNQNLTIDSGWTRLDPTAWVFRFIGNDVDVYANINPFTGKVVEFHSRWHGPSPYVREYNGTNPMTKDDIEESALSFLNDFDYSLNPNARYIGPEVEYDIGFVSHYVYSLRYFNVINETIVWGNVVTLHLDIKTGEIVDFSYSWTYIPSIPMQNSISSQLAESSAANYIAGLSEPTEARIQSSSLIFGNGIGEDGDGTYRLVWAVTVASDTIGTIFVDAISQEVISVQQNTLTSKILQPPAFQLHLLVIISLPSASLAILAFVVSRRRIWISNKQEDGPN
ncbi:MAG: hypothetical protein P1Q69_13980 [Candidatus Thorarchaeota archaeon]|nr:hypothetical protein [Candidatus Thorarchaeota archaeon]